MKNNVSAFLSSFTVVASLFYFLHYFIGIALYSEYNWLTQAVSDLTAQGSSSAPVAKAFALLYGFFSLLGIGGILFQTRKLSNKTLRWGVVLFLIMHSVSLFGYWFFPLSEPGISNSFQDFVHVYIVTVSVVLLSVFSLILLAFGSKGKYPVLLYASLCALGLMITGAILTSLVPKEIFGLAERISVFSVVIFTGLLGPIFHYAIVK